LRRRPSVSAKPVVFNFYTNLNPMALAGRAVLDGLFYG